MRFADGPTVEVDVQIDAPPSRVWELVCDVALPAKFSTEFQGGEWLDGAEPSLGATFKGRNYMEGIGEWETTSVVVEYEPERVFAWAVGNDAETAAALWRFELQPEGAGTRLKQFVRLGPGQSGLTAAIDRMPEKEERIIQRRQEGHRANMQATVEGIKSLAEQPS
jgi:uncharacterized protein YndB with AHSA1/START domain